MPNHFLSIGLPIRSGDDLRDHVEQALAEGDRREVPGGYYLIWPPGARAQLWLQYVNDEVVGVAPHYSGAARMRVRIDVQGLRDPANPLDGCFQGWARQMSEREGSSDAFPFVLDTPDYATYGALALPLVGDVQIAGFAHELTAYPDEAAYRAASQRELQLASESFIPTGFYNTGSESDTAPPPALAIINGMVLDTAAEVNPATGERFYHAHVRTYGGEVDLVSDPATLEGTLVAGGVISGSFWLSGQLIAAASNNS